MYGGGNNNRVRQGHHTRRVVVVALLFVFFLKWACRGGVVFISIVSIMNLPPLRLLPTPHRTNTQPHSSSLSR